MKDKISHRKNGAFNGVTQRVIDRLLDKILVRGVGSLTSMEKQYMDTIDPELESKLLNTMRSKRYPRFSFEVKNKDDRSSLSGILTDHGEGVEYDVLCDVKNDGCIDSILFFENEKKVEPFTIFDDEYYEIKEFISKEVLANIY